MLNTVFCASSSKQVLHFLPFLCLKGGSISGMTWWPKHHHLTQPDRTQQTVFRIISPSPHALRSTTYISSVSLLRNQAGSDWNYHFDALTFRFLNKAENNLSTGPSGSGEADWHQLQASTMFNLIHVPKFGINTLTDKEIILKHCIAIQF